MSANENDVTFDLEGLRAWYGGNIPQLLSGFIDDVDRASRVMKRSIDDHDYERILETSHEIKGVSGTIGARRIYRIFVALEEAARNENDCGCKKLLSSLDAARENIKEFADRV